MVSGPWLPMCVSSFCMSNLLTNVFQKSSLATMSDTSSPTDSGSSSPALESTGSSSPALSPLSSSPALSPLSSSSALSPLPSSASAASSLASLLTHQTPTMTPPPSSTSIPTVSYMTLILTQPNGSIITVRLSLLEKAELTHL